MVLAKPRNPLLCLFGELLILHLPCSYTFHSSILNTTGKRETNPAVCGISDHLHTSNELASKYPNSLLKTEVWKINTHNLT